MIVGKAVVDGCSGHRGVPHRDADLIQPADYIASGVQAGYGSLHLPIDVQFTPRARLSAHCNCDLRLAFGT